MNAVTMPLAGMRSTAGNEYTAWANTRGRARTQRIDAFGGDVIDGGRGVRCLGLRKG